MTETLSEQAITSLVNDAREAARHAYAPFSGYPVGAAILTANGRVFRGANVENSSYPEGLCAERVAVVKAVSDGEREFIAIAVATPDLLVWPCGGCRQVLFEFSPGLLLIAAGADEVAVKNLAALLPEGFRLPRPSGLN